MPVMNTYQRIAKLIPTQEERRLIDLSKVERTLSELERDILDARKKYSPLYRTNELEDSNKEQEQEQEQIRKELPKRGGARGNVR